MVSPSATDTMTFLPVRGGRWSATTETPDGPMTAIGDSIGEAKAALDALLVIAREVASRVAATNRISANSLITLTSGPVILKALSNGRWSATMETKFGPLTAFGISMDAARAALEELLDGMTKSEA